MNRKAATKLDMPQVFIVGAGPGAVDLLTIKGMQALRKADIIFYDALVNPEIFQYAGHGAERVFVGKRCGKRAMEQWAINERIIASAKSGKTVVRLKGGDPLLFGRGGEEALACKQHGIRFEIIPGVTSALGAASYSGIPLTHRAISSSIAFVTPRDFRTAPKNRSLSDIAKSVDTLVVYMGGLQLAEIVCSLMAGGLAPNTPIAVISRATLPDQQTVLGTLEDIDAGVTDVNPATPMLVIVGNVVRLSPVLNWHEGNAPEQLFAAIPFYTHSGDINEALGESRII